MNELKTLKQEKHKILYLLKNKKLANLDQQEVTQLEIRLEEISKEQDKLYENTRKTKLVEKYKNELLK